MRVVSIIVAAVAFAGCSALTSLDDLSGPSDATGADSGGSDGGGTDGGGSDVVQLNDAGGNLVANGGFENGQGGCGSNWGNGYGNTFARVSPGHSGTSACLVCTNSSNPTSFQINAIAPIPVQAGSYYAEAWLGTPWDGGISTANVGLQIMFTGDGGLSGCTGDSTYCQGSFVSSPPWATSSASFVVTGSGTVTLDIHSYAGDAGACFVMDDVALYAQ